MSRVPAVDQLPTWGELGADVLRRIPEQGLLGVAPGTPITVPPGQIVLVLHEGAVVAELGSGRHLLTSALVPGLDDGADADDGLALDGDGEHRDPLCIALLVLNTRTLVKRWGTRNPMSVHDPAGRTLDLRAHGAYALRVTSPAILGTVCLGQQSIRHNRRLEHVLRDLIVGRLAAELERFADHPDTMQAELGQVTQRARRRLETDFARCGLELGDLSLHGIVLPDPPDGEGSANGNRDQAVDRSPYPDDHHQDDGTAEHRDVAAEHRGVAAEDGSGAVGGAPQTAPRARRLPQSGLGKLLTRFQVLTLADCSPNGAPANGSPANGAPANGAPANGAPANGAPANGASPDDGDHGTHGMRRQDDAPSADPGTCPRCDHPAPAGARFCPWCGQPTGAEDR
ncbi:MAG: SPFH domain-containing protein [Candidatus Eiseniibacteriota bacterium]|jgi:membrane protease subunit (stomatin/prohibitin family)